MKEMGTQLCTGLAWNLELRENVWNHRRPLFPCCGDTFGLASGTSDFRLHQSAATNQPGWQMRCCGFMDLSRVGNLPTSLHSEDFEYREITRDLLCRSVAGATILGNEDQDTHTLPRRAPAR